MRAAELGRQRSECEQDIKDTIRKNREAEEKRAHLSAATEGMKKEEVIEHKKEYRGMIKKREQELADDKKRREKQAQLIMSAQKVHEAKRKVQQGYMKELHETSLIKQHREKRQRELEAEQEREYKKAEYDHRMQMQTAEHADSARKTAYEHEAKDRKTLIDTDVKTHEYHLEEWKRSRMLRVDNESMQQLHAATNVQHKVRRQKVENEWNERKTGIIQEATRRKNEIDNDFYGKKAQSESELRRMIHQSDTELAHKNEEIEQKYKKLQRDLLM